MAIHLIVRLAFDKNWTSCASLILGSFLYMALINKIEKLPMATHSTMILILHIVTFSKIISSLSVAIRENERFPQGMSVGTMISILFSIQAIASIYPDYKKAMIIFSCYWGSYLTILSVYFWELNLRELMMYGSLFWLVYIIFKENYGLNTSATDISLDSHDDPTIIVKDNNLIKVNKKFR